MTEKPLQEVASVASHGVVLLSLLLGVVFPFISYKFINQLHLITVTVQLTKNWPTITLVASNVSAKLWMIPTFPVPISSFQRPECTNLLPVCWIFDQLAMSKIVKYIIEFQKTCLIHSHIVGLKNLVCANYS